MKANLALVQPNQSVARGNRTRGLRFIEKTHEKPVVPNGYNFNLIKPIGKINGLDIQANPALQDHNCEIRWLNPAEHEIFIDYNYQRELSASDISLTKEIGENFDWAQFKVPTLCENADGRLFCTDGQKTTITAIYNNLTIPFFVFKSADNALQRQASSFVGINTNRNKVSSSDMFSALIYRGDKNENALAKILLKHGIKPLKTVSGGKKIFQPLETTCINILRAIHKAHDTKTFDIICQLLVYAQFRPIKRDHLWALNLIMYRIDPASIDIDRMGNAICSIVDKHAILEAQENKRRAKTKTTSSAELAKIYETRYKLGSRALA